MAGIKDFFKQRASNPSANSKSASNASSSMAASPKKPDDPFSQKLSRSKKTLVKSSTSSSASTVNSTLASTKKNPVIIDDDSEGEGTTLTLNKRIHSSPLKSKEPSPKKVRTTTSSTSISAAKTLPTRASPSKTSPAKASPSKTSPAKASPSKSSPAKKFSYREYLQKRSAGPIAPGSKEIPKGAPNCLLGLAFVFTGELESLSREDAQDLVKRYGGRITSAPSGKTSYVVVGAEAGASKLEKVKSLGLKTLSEDELLDLIHQSLVKSDSSHAPPSHSTLKKTKALPYSEEEIIKAVVVKNPPLKSFKGTIVQPEMANVELWTERYAPQIEEELVGNHSNYEKLVEWLSKWNQHLGNSERAVLISGPPGIGKTTAAHMACRQLGVEVVEMNASDTRSKSTLHQHVRDMIDNRSIVGFSEFLSKENATSNATRASYKKQVLIMDEVDGMSAGDRGGMAELIQLIKKTKIPIICICNDRSSPKVRSLANYCVDLRFRRPDARQVTPRIMAIAKKEGLELGVNTVEELVASTQGDIRQILNILSTYRLTAHRLDYDQSKRLGGAAKKDVERGPFDAVPALLGAGYGKMSLAERIDMYFVDSSLVPLMIQENYLKAKANTSRQIRGSSCGDHLELAAAAAESISDADIVDSLIRGANQEWSLAPLHAVLSSVRPAYYCHGAMGGRVDFATWLGNNSKSGKNSRLLGELTKHSYLHTGGVGKQQLRLAVLPVMAERLLRPLMDRGVEGVDQTIAMMDGYTLSRDDFDSILELMVDPAISATAYSKIPTATKTAFTRKYNQGTHRLPYALGGPGASISGSLVKRISEIKLGGDDDGVDIEYADDDNAEDNGEDNDEADNDDISKDKMIRAKTATSKANPGTAGASTGRKGRGRGRGK